MTSTSHPWPGNRVDASRVRQRAIVLPGGGYTVAHPLLHWTCLALAEAGWFVQAVRWDADGLRLEDAPAFVTGAAARAADDAPPAGTTLVVGKSLGSFAARWATERGWPGVWLTPLLSRPEIAVPLAEAARAGIPGLLVGGTADPSWDSAVAHDIGHDVHEVEGADHSLESTEGWIRSIDSVRAAVGAVTEFAGTL